MPVQGVCRAADAPLIVSGGHNRNRFAGPAFSSIHEGTEALLNESTDNMLNGYRFGADFRATKKTTLSYTQLLQSYNLVVRSRPDNGLDHWPNWRG